MENAIEIKGYWWLPKSKRNKLLGTLIFSQEDGASLEVVGLFRKEKIDINKVEEPIIILGITQGGKPITLYKCLPTKLTYTLIGSGLDINKYYAHFIFEGVHFHSENEIKFNKLYGSYTDLNAWIGIHGFVIERNYADNQLTSNIKYEEPKSQFFDINDSFQVGIGFLTEGPNYSIVQTNIKISQQSYLIVKSKNADIEFNNIFDQLNTFSDLLQIATQQIPYPISIFGLSEANVEKINKKEKYYPKINIYYRPIETPVNRKEKLPKEMVFTYSDLEVEQINNWFSSFNKYKTVFDLYRSLFYNNRLFTETRFINIAQALESLHSIMFDNQYLSDAVFKKQKERVLEVVPNDLSEWVETALSSANYKRFSLKISELIDKKSNILSQCIGETKEFVKRVRDTRNEFVHQHPLRWTFTKKELPSAINLLIMLFETYLLEILGFSDEKIQKLLEQKVEKYLANQKFLKR